MCFVVLLFEPFFPALCESAIDSDADQDQEKKSFPLSSYQNLTVRGPRPGATEQEYYRAEYTEDEQARGLHTRAMNFAHEASVHGGSQHGGSAFGSRRGSRTNLSRAASKGDLQAAGSAKAGDDSARGDTAKI